MYGVLSGKYPTLDLGMTISKDIRVRGFWLSKWFKTAGVEQIRAAFGQIIPLIAGGGIKADVDSTFTIDEIKEGLIAHAVDHLRDRMRGFANFF